MVKKGNVIKVSKCCLFQFSIGKKYKDEVWCEVIPMDACHVLLGRPWQYDRRTKHGGFLNTHSFKKDMINIVLAPLDTRESVVDNLFLSKTEFMGLTKLTPQPIIYVIILTEENGLSPIVQDLVQPLINEFIDVFLEDIPLGLPLMREIQHCIDFFTKLHYPKQTRLQHESERI